MLFAAILTFLGLSSIIGAMILAALSNDGQVPERQARGEFWLGLFIGLGGAAALIAAGWRLGGL